MGRKKTHKILKKPFNRQDFEEISLTQLKKELSETEIEFLDNTKKFKTHLGIFKIEK